jgi:hypothetical protein
MLEKAQGGASRSVSGATSAAPRQRPKAALVCAARFGITVDRNAQWGPRGATGGPISPTKRFGVLDALD